MAVVLWQLGSEPFSAAAIGWGEAQSGLRMAVAGEPRNRDLAFSVLLEFARWFNPRFEAFAADREMFTRGEYTFTVARSAPQLVVANRAMVELIGRLGRWLAYLPTDGPRPADLTLVRLGRHLRFLWDQYAVPGQQLVVALVRMIATRYCAGWTGRTATFVPASTVSLPDPIRTLPGVREAKAKDANSHDLIIGTLSKLGDTFARGDLDPFDLLLVDEAYQADSAKYFAVGGLAPLHLLVGDAGQISPFATIVDPGRWRGLPEDPLQTAVGVLRRNHPCTPVHGLSITRRLDSRAVGIARLFYPDLSFRAAVLPGVREFRLAKGTATNRHLDSVLTLAAREGLAHVELPRAAVLQSDPEAVELIADLVARMFDRNPWVRCEREPAATPLTSGRVAVGVSHNDQKDQLRAALNDRGLEGVVVETANKLQGLEFEVVFVWHPLAGLPEADEFHLDPGRLCVLLTRHRQACVVVGRAGDRDVLDDRPPPPTAAYLGHDADPVLDGWEIDQSVYSALEPYRLAQPRDANNEVTWSTERCRNNSSFRRSVRPPRRRTSPAEASAEHAPGPGGTPSATAPGPGTTGSAVRPP